MGLKSKILYWGPKILAVLFGAFLIVFGEKDDSPGAQGLGLILIVAMIVLVARGKKKK